MSQPRDYTRQFNFKDYQATTPADPLPGTQVDAELNAVKLTLDDLNTNIAKVQRDDGKLGNQAVHKDAFDPGALALINVTGFTPQGDWTTGRSYAVGDIVDFNSGTYLATAAHTSSSAFATDNTANRWILIANAAISGTSSAVDKFEGDGSTTVFTLTYSYASTTSIQVFVNGELLNPTDDYTISGNQLTLFTAPGLPTVTGNENVIIWGASVVGQAAADAASASASNASGFADEADNWARKTTGLVESADYSSKAYAIGGTGVDAGSGSAKDWATKTSSTVGNTSEYSSKYWATQGNVPIVATNISDVNTVAGISSNVTTVSGMSGNITTVAGVSAAVTTVAGISSNVTAVAGDAADIGTVAADLGGSNTIGTVAGSITNVNTVASNVSDVSTVSGVSGNVTTVAGISSNVTTVAGISANVTTVAGQTTNLQNVTDNLSAIQNAGTNATNAASSATAAASSQTAAAASQVAAAASASSAANSFDSFDDRYLGVKNSDPTTDNDGDALASGMLYFSSSENIMKVYDGASWIAATSAGNVSLTTFQYSASGGQTTFSGSDANSATLSYTVNNILVTLNGSLLFNGTDYTATNGTSVVLASGATASDVLQVTSFKSFTTADMVPASTGGTFAGNVAVSGNLTVDTNTLYVDSSNNLVGIKTSSPSSYYSADLVVDTVDEGGLTLVSDTTHTAYLMFADGTSGADRYRGQIFYDHNLDRMGIATNSATRILIDASGNTEIKGGSELRVYRTDNNAYGSIKYLTGAGGLELKDTNGDGMSFKGASSTYMTIANSGNVGIGVTPTSPLGANFKVLDINSGVWGGTINFSGNSAGYIGNRHSGNTGLGYYAVSGKGHHFAVNGTTTAAATIDSSGRLLVGKSSNSLSTAGTTLYGNGKIEGVRDGDLVHQMNRLSSDGPILDFQKDSSTKGRIGVNNGDPYLARNNGNGFRWYSGAVVPTDDSGNDANNAMDLGSNSVRFKDLYLSGNANVGDRLLVNGATSNAQLSVLGDASLRAQNVQVAVNGHTAIGFFNASGTEVGGISVAASATAYNTSSDYRLKENVDYTWDATTRLKQLKPARFNFIADADTTVDGFLAHEAQAIVPESVTGTKDEVDADGNAVMQGIDQAKLVPLLVKTIQELEARITALEEE